MKQVQINRFVIGFLFSAFTATAVQAMDVKISESLEYVETGHGGRLVKIERIQDTENVLTGSYTKTSRQCPPFCVQPMQVAPGVNTVGELELLDFIENEVNPGTGVLVDARTESWFEKGTIPGSVNIPFTHFDAEAEQQIKAAALEKLGVSPENGSGSWFGNLFSLVGIGSASASNQWDFSHAKDVLLWCNGMWCGQSPRAIHNLLEMGYPAEKIHYYRGGMQAWKSLGLTVK